jgi:hypothetical protein
LDAAATSGSPVLKHGPMPPAAEEGVNALGFWNVVARGDASVERGRAGQRECGTFDCSRHVWFTRAQARAYAAGGGGGRKRPRRVEWLSPIVRRTLALLRFHIFT